MRQAFRERDRLSRVKTRFTKALTASATTFLSVQTEPRGDHQRKLLVPFFFFQYPYPE